ncbi:MAG: hypothetical protein ABIF85_04880 [Nanoarchaeota archaeon]
MREKPALLPFDKDPKDYDMIFIGTPVWAFSYSAPFNTFFHETELKNKKIALFICHGGGKKRHVWRHAQSASGKRDNRGNRFLRASEKRQRIMREKSEILGYEHP